MNGLMFRNSLTFALVSNQAVHAPLAIRRGEAVFPDLEPLKAGDIGLRRVGYLRTER